MRIATTHRDGSVSEEEIPDPPRPKATLKQLGFTRLCRTAGGATFEQIKASQSDPLLEEMWFDFNLASEIEFNDIGTQAGLDALDALGYLPNGKQAVIDAWPTQ